MQLEFGYGASVQTVEIPEKNVMAILTANEIQHSQCGEAAVRDALATPIGMPKLRDIPKPGQRIAVIVSDISRPVPSYEILPAVLDELSAAGCHDTDITVVFALGSHRRHTEKEKMLLVGAKVYARVRCVDSDPDDCICMGFTENGTPVDVTRLVAEADFRICTGNIEFHYFAGYSGGVKAIMPGVSSFAAIQANHKLMVQSGAYAGNLETNPLRKDIEEAGRICGVNYLVNVVLDEHKHIVYAVAGDPVEAHRAGCRYLDRMYRTPIPAQADIVLVSQGGAPKDANLYQTQKALDNAKHAVKNGGTIVLIGACPEGAGSKVFERWLIDASTPHALIERVHKHFELGGHKAAAIAMVLEIAHVDLVSEMPDALVRDFFMNPQPSVQKALDDALKRHGTDASVLAMPYGGATLPTIVSD